MKPQSYWDEYLIWGCAVVVACLILMLPIWVMFVALGITFLILWVVHHNWG